MKLQPTVYTLTSVGVLLVAIRWVREAAPEDHNALPDPVKVFFERHNLVDTYDAEMAALKQMPRPGQLPDAPKKRHPVVIVPGIISCGLEAWQSRPCLGNFFRRRIWSGTDMASAAIGNASCWLEHLALDSTTGLDPDGIRVRSAKGLHAADYFIPGYWLWGKVIENLGDIGYTEEDILMECYDWRLAFPLLEKRDGYFSKMRLDIEHAVQHSGEKAVVLGHSMGALVWLHFMSWIEQSAPGWVDRHIASFANIGGAMLGALGPLAAYLSGEMEATANLGLFGDAIDRYMLSWSRLRDFYWSLGGLASLLPKGGTAVWGSSETGWTDSPVDTVEVDFVTHDLPPGPRALEYLYERFSGPFSNRSVSGRFYNLSVQNPRGKPAGDERNFANALSTALPSAPNLKIFCLYGVGIPTERAYKYSAKLLRWMWADAAARLLVDPSRNPFRWSAALDAKGVMADMKAYLGTEDANRPIRLDLAGRELDFTSVDDGIQFLAGFIAGTHVEETEPEEWFRIDTDLASAADFDPWGNGVDGIFKAGVSHTDGDGTVPLVSLGYMCSNGWRDFSELNPANISVWTKESKNKPVWTDPRGGPSNAKHVEIIGNREFITDILHIAAGETVHLEKDQIISNISKIGPVITERLRPFF
eukprot:TRINITY_DN39334_c0_g1_i1.p1 TRINITY_DN39334_c0_g1~~TRINITY_DN39334_c0_g1_i1.p1  ORF type:complete len:645 (+),score=98.69 TRINITY_DN39334_c0_g1_i1:37-1971(+)